MNEEKNVDKKFNLSLLTKAIERFSNFSKWWASINLITLSTFLVGLSFLVVNLNNVYLKTTVIIIYIITIILCNIMAINYLALEKSARNQYALIDKGQQGKIKWNIVKVKPYFWKAFKSWSIYIPFFIYFIYVFLLIIIAFY